MRLNVSSVKWRSFCLDLNVLSNIKTVIASRKGTILSAPPTPPSRPPLLVHRILTPIMQLHIDG